MGSGDHQVVMLMKGEFSLQKEFCAVFPINILLTYPSLKLLMGTAGRRIEESGLVI